MLLPITELKYGIADTFVPNVQIPAATVYSSVADYVPHYTVNQPYQLKPYVYTVLKAITFDELVMKLINGEFSVLLS